MSICLSKSCNDILNWNIASSRSKSNSSYMNDLQGGASSYHIIAILQRVHRVGPQGLEMDPHTATGILRANHGRSIPPKSKHMTCHLGKQTHTDVMVFFFALWLRLSYVSSASTVLLDSGSWVALARENYQKEVK
jgi:hypothetical protein